MWRPPDPRRSRRFGGWRPAFKSVRREWFPRRARIGHREVSHAAARSAVEVKRSARSHKKPLDHCAGAESCAHRGGIGFTPPVSVDASLMDGRGRKREQA